MKCLVSATSQPSLNAIGMSGVPTVSDETAKVPAHDAVPCRTLAVVELHAD